MDRSRGGRGGDPPRRVGGRAGRLGARLGTVADRAVHGTARLPPETRTSRGPRSTAGRLEEIRFSALECYAAVALGVGGSELAPGERVARELVELAPYRERAHALLMEILVARGNAPRRCASTSVCANACATSSVRRPRPSFASSNNACSSADPTDQGVRSDQGARSGRGSNQPLARGPEIGRLGAIERLR